MKFLSLDGVTEFLAELKNLFVSKTELSAHTSNHAPSNAEKNQNAFSNVAVGSTLVAADSATDTLTLVAGSNVTLTPDATNDKVTIAATDTVYTHPNYTARTGVPTANATLSHGGTFTVSQPVSDSTGHVTAVNSRTYTLPSETALSKGTDATTTSILSHSGTFKAITGVAVSGHQITPTVTTFTLPSDNNTDTKVTQTVTTTNASYPLLLAPSGQTATTTTTSYFDSGVTLNPSTNTIAANVSGSSASCTGNAATATSATKLGTTSMGNQTSPVYFSAGSPSACSTYAGGTSVTLNGTSKAATTASFYAPTSAGTSGYLLKSSGSGAPTWLQSVPVANGGTGSTTVAGAISNLGAMDLTSAQTASGVKTFSNGINIGSANLTYDSASGALVVSFV